MGKTATAQNSALATLRGVGPQLAAKLAKLGIREARDLLFHLPSRYEDRTRITPIGSLQPGQPALIVGEIIMAQIQAGRRRSLLVGVEDASGAIRLRFFHFTTNQYRQFSRGGWIQAFGEAQGYGSFDMVHPEYRLHAEPPSDITAPALTPIYPTTDGIGQARMRNLVEQSLRHHRHELADLIPPALSRQYGLMALDKALLAVHRPPPDADTAALAAGVHPAQRRLALEEMLAHHLALKALRRRRKHRAAPVIAADSPSWEQLRNRLDFTLTAAQQRVIAEIRRDIACPHPCLRLVQGDVGSGKTIVAAAAALHAIDTGYQVALMAPTELLAEQHKHTFFGWFDALGITVEWLSGKLPAATRRRALQNTAAGSAQIVIGTHALFQKEVTFHRLGLLIIDEQHRFGVDQRLALKEKAGECQPHQLIMSATPIPRSMAMIMYADLDISSIDELPPGRKPVKTVAMPAHRRAAITQRILAACQNGQQAYWVCPLIDESDHLDAQAATNTYQDLTRHLPQLRIELLHGKLASRQKEQIMHAFKDGTIDLLVATTVIEVGVDVANANLMIIENAERLGLAQLHQLRGRVGRGAAQATCVLLYDPPLGRLARDRLGIIRETNDGFLIAHKDLEHRGPGELLGTRQTGLQKMHIADLVRDRELIPLVEQLGSAMKDPQLTTAIIARWLAGADIYGQV